VAGTNLTITEARALNVAPATNTLSVLGQLAVNGASSIAYLSNYANRTNTTTTYGLGLDTATSTLNAQTTVNLSIGGTAIATVTANALAVKATDSAAATVLDVLTVQRLSSTTTSTGTGAAIIFKVQNGAGTTITGSRISNILQTVTNAAEYSDLVFYTMVNGTLTVSGTVSGGSSGVSGYSVPSGARYVIGTFAAIVLSISATNGTSATYSANTCYGHSFTGVALATGARQFFQITPQSNTNQTLSTAIAGFEYKTFTRQWATGTIAAQHEFVVNAPTYGFVGASTITIAASFYVTGAPIAGTNATITNNYCARFGARVRFDGEVALGGGATATLGTIGGSGPTGAAQVGWMPVGTDLHLNAFYPVFA
jgi:hypothetical protein